MSRIGGKRYEQECSNLLHANLDSSYMDVYRDIFIRDIELTECKNAIEELKIQQADPVPPNERGL